MSWFTTNSGSGMPYAGLSDSELDTAYAASFDAGAAQNTIDFGAEIGFRVQNISSFVAGIFGSNPFPLYAARTGFSVAQAAQGSTIASAVNVAGTIQSGATSVVNGTLSVFKWPLIIAAVVGIGYIYLQTHKK
jgi:hypothetical protein